MTKRPRRRMPFIGPTRCPLHLWFLQFEDARGIWRRYFANRDEARTALRVFKADVAQTRSGRRRATDARVAE